MSDAISVTVYSNDGTQISVTRNEGIRDYCMRVFASQTAEVQKLFVDMLNYGAAAQVQFTYNVDDLANALLSDEQKALATGEISYENTRVATANFVGTNFDLENSILLNYYFNNITTDMKARVTFTDFRGVEHEVIIDGSEFIKNGSAYQINISETVVADGRCGITCEILDGETVVESVTDSMESYVARVAADYPHLVEMLKFSDSASEYLLNRN